jgi:hypothetical protein
MKVNPSSAATFHGFGSYEKLYEFTLSIDPGLSVPELCVVQFDPVYGYPKHISYTTPHEYDSFGEISINKFQLDP